MDANYHWEKAYTVQSEIEVSCFGMIRTPIHKVMLFEDDVIVSFSGARSEADWIAGMLNGAFNLGFCKHVLTQSVLACTEEIFEWHKVYYVETHTYSYSKGLLKGKIHDVMFEGDKLVSFSGSRSEADWLVGLLNGAYNLGFQQGMKQTIFAETSQ